MSGSRCWCFTGFEPLEWYKISFAQKVAGLKSFKYLVMGEEVSPTTDKIHVQGFIEFSRSYPMDKIKDWMRDRALHLEQMYSTEYEASEYCKKDGNWVEYGEKPVKFQGARNDLKGINKLVLEENHTVRQLMRNGVIKNFQQYKFACLCQDYADRPNREYVAKEVYVLFGGTGRGKTRFVNHHAPRAYWTFDPDLKWWDGYVDQEDVVIDEFRRNCKLAHLLRLLDGYEMTVETKGSRVSLNKVKRIFITSNKDPKEWYPGCGEDVQQLHRRITKVIDVGEAWTPEPAVDAEGRSYLKKVPNTVPFDWRTCPCVAPCACSEVGSNTEVPT